MYQQPLGSNPWVITPALNRPVCARLFCFPHAGGGTAPFRGWQSHFAPEVEVCLIQLPGREKRFNDAPLTQWVPLLNELGPGLLPYLDKPYALFGHSMGALICFEVARWVQKARVPSPAHVFISGFPAPQFHRAESTAQSLPDEVLIETLRGMQGVPASVFAHQELLQLFLSVLRADLTLMESYVYEAAAPLFCPITVFGGQDDPGVKPEDLAGWQELTSASFTARLLPGAHFYLHGASEGPLLTMLAEQLCSSVSGPPAAEIA